MGVPSSSGGTGLALTVPDDSDSDVVRLVHDGPIGNGQTVTKLTTLVDGTGGLGIDLRSAKSTAGNGGALTCEGNPPGEEKALTKASIPSADIGYWL